MKGLITRQLQTASATETEALGESIGRRLRGGETIELISDLGGGKTTFVRGLARGAGSTDNVASPTFTISKQYRAGRLQLHHFDCYRLQEVGIMHDELRELADDPAAVIIVEWSDIVKPVLATSRLSLELAPITEHSRQITIRYPAELAYVLDGQK